MTAVTTTRDRQLLSCGSSALPFDFTYLILLGCLMFGLLIPISSLYKYNWTKQNAAKKRKARELAKQRTTRRESQGLGVKRLLVRTGKLAAGENERLKWEIEYKKLKLKKKIGAGNFGEVWQATWLGSPVAVKSIVKGMQNKKDFLQKFLEEIDLMSRLHHPNIVMFLGACITAPNICLVLEYCTYGNLMDFLKDEEVHQISISMHIILKMALDIARGINYLHQKENIIQRDIKSRNVLVDENLNAKVADFGLSRLKEDGDAGMTACGTPAWTAPEVVRMEDYNEKVDVYSFGIVMWELIMREEPYEGEGGVQIAYLAAEQGLRPKIPNFVPQSYATLMAECWDDDAVNRPNFGQILERLFKMMKDESDPMRAAFFYFGQRESNAAAILANQYLTDEDYTHHEATDGAPPGGGSERRRMSSSNFPPQEGSGIINHSESSLVYTEVLSQLFRKKSKTFDEVWGSTQVYDQDDQDDQGANDKDDQPKSVHTSDRSSSGSSVHEVTCEDDLKLMSVKTAARKSKVVPDPLMQ